MQPVKTSIRSNGEAGAANRRAQLLRFGRVIGVVSGPGP
jgi:hypothetical protein